MGLFREVFCEECGAKASMLTRKQVLTGEYICSKCLKPYPAMIKDSLLFYTYEDYKDLKEYKNYSDTVLNRVFRETHSYKNLHLDQDNGLFYLDDEFPKMYLQVGNVNQIGLFFEPEKVKEGLLSANATGTVTLGLEMRRPIIQYKKIVDHSAKAEAQVNILGTKVKCSNPKKMDAFIEAFNKSNTGLNL